MRNGLDGWIGFGRDGACRKESILVIFSTFVRLTSPSRGRWAGLRLCALLSRSCACHWTSFEAPLACRIAQAREQPSAFSGTWYFAHVKSPQRRTICCNTGTVAVAIRVASLNQSQHCLSRRTPARLNYSILLWRPEP